jgi:hypothetical protein
MARLSARSSGRTLAQATLTPKNLRPNAMPASLPHVNRAIALLGIASRGVKADVLDLRIGEDGSFPNTGQASAKVGRRPVGSEAAGSAEKP